MSQHLYTLTIASDWAIDPIEVDNVLREVAHYIKESFDVPLSATFTADRPESALERP